jgi:cytochrome b
MPTVGETPARLGVRARLWDAPTRLVHWLLAALIVFCWWSAEVDRLDWHRLSGYAILGLLTFRIFWGFAGASSARFSGFVKGPKAALAYVRTLPDRAARDTPGHNPLGALSVLAVLAALMVQVATGLFAVDVDGIESGPLSDRVEFDTGRLLARVHHWGFQALEVLVALHLAAIAFYLIYKRANLVGPMITGRRVLETDPQVVFAPAWRWVLGVVLATAVAWIVAKGFRV